MYYYTFSDKMTEEALKKLCAQAPSQAAAVLLAAWELKDKVENGKVSEDAIIDHIGSDLARFSPRAKSVDVIPGFVAYYRAMLGKLPAHILTQDKDSLGAKARGGKRGGGAETIVDPITGEAMANVFKRDPVKNPGSRKTRKIVTEETLEDDDDVPADFEEEAAE